MTIAFECSNCGATLRVPDTSAGRRGRCPKCSTINLIPALGGQVQTAPSAPKSAPPRAAKAAPAPEVPDEGEEAGAAEARPRRKGKKKGNRTLLFVGLGCGALLLLTCMGGGVGVGVWWYMSSSGLGDELAYMPGNCEYVASIRLDQLLASDAYKQIEKEVPQLKQVATAGGDAEKEMGLQLSDIERIVVGGPLSNRDQPVVVFRTKKAINGDDLKGKMKGKTFTGTKVGSYTLYESSGASGDAFCVPKKNMILYGSSAALRVVLKRDKKPDFSSGLSAAMKEADFSKTVAVAIAPLQTGAPAGGLGGRGGFPMAGPMPFGQAKDLEGMAIQAKVANDISLNVVILFKDSSTASEAKKKIDEAMPQLKSNPMVPPDLKNALNIKSSVSGKKLTMTTDIKVAPIIKAVKDFAPLLGGMGKAGGK